MRILFRSSFNRYSGYGNDAVDIAKYLVTNTDHDVHLWPMNAYPGLPVEVAQLFTKVPTRGEYDLVLCFSAPMYLVPKEWADAAPLSIGWSMWERSLLLKPDFKGFHWGNRGNQQFKGINRMLVTCPMNVEAFANVDPVIPIEVLPCGVDGEEFPERKRDSDGPMKFIMIGELGIRKDPFVLINAWNELKEEHPEFDAVIEFKTTKPGVHPKIQDWMKDCKVYSESWPYEKVKQWYYSADVLVTPSRGEGNNKPAMEFMATGGTVIASDWSGHQNWLHPDCNYALKGELHRVDPQSPAEDFRADKDHLKELLYHCWANRPEAQEKGMNAARFIRQSLSWETVIEKLDRIITREAQSASR